VITEYEKILDDLDKQYNEPTCLDRKESGIRWTPYPLIQLL